MILAPGLHPNIPAPVYHADPAPEPSLSASIAQQIVSRSSLHAWHNHPRLNPAYAPENNSIMDAGSIAHAILLEGGTSRLVVVQAADWRKKEAQEQRDQAWANGGIPVLAHKLATINAMVEAAKKYLAASELAGVFDQGDAELTMIWQEGAAYCRSRPDWLTADRAIMLDYKSTATNADPNAFVRQILLMGYDMQAAFYLRGAAYHDIHPTFVFLVQENEPPYACSLVGLTPQMLDFGERKVESAITLWNNCIAKNQWRGYPSRVCYAELPEYAVKQWDERASLEEIIEPGTQA